MNGWRKENLECVCEILDTLRKPITKRDRTTGKYPYYGATGIVDYVADYIFDEKLVLVGEDGAKWASGETTAFIAEGKYWVNNHAHVLRPSKNVILHEWLSYYLTHLDLSPFVGGLTVPKLNQGNLKLIPVSFPSLPEQKRIVEILDEAFDGIAKATANAQRNLANARGLIDGAIASALSATNLNWETRRLEDCFRLKSGDNLTSSQMIEGDYPVYGGNGIAGMHNSTNLDGDNVIVGRVGALCGNARRIVGSIWLTDNAFRVCDKKVELHNGFLAYLLNFKKLRSLARQSAQPVISNSSLRDLSLSFPISISDQQRISDQLDMMTEVVEVLEKKYQAKITTLENLKQSLLHKAFTGQLTSSSAVPAAQKLESPMTANAKLTAQVIVLAHYRHAVVRRDKTFGHVKAQKILHLAESCANVPLGRSPIKDAAGPNDFAHMLRAEEWAESNGFFKFNQRDSGYSFQKMKGYNQLLSEAQERLKPFKQKLDKILGLLVPMDTQEAEVFATVHAAWNNLVVDRKPITDDAIIKEARDNWHQDKLKIPKAKFLKAILLIRKEGLVPDGSAKPVRLLQEKLL